ncbi:MAG: LysM peptidoglycan-binding domain-containing protein [bacterium]|nr:LysM peptidoglycan-binding domain-containing protein [bacterium]
MVGCGRFRPRTLLFPGLLAVVLVLTSGCSLFRRDEPAEPADVVAAVDAPGAPGAAQAAPVEPEVSPEAESGRLLVQLVPDEEATPNAHERREAEGFTDLEEFPFEAVYPGEAFSESPLDDLASVTPEITPEQAEAARVQVQDAAPTFDIPMVVNDKVTAFVDYYTNRQQTWFKSSLERSGRYLPMFREIYTEAGLPLDLIYMAHVESGYKTTAYSRARARGIFQFMASTARVYGLRVDYWVDERADPEKSARASAAYLNKLYRDFGDWYLVLAAYNAGEGKIRRALRRSGKNDFWGIAKTRYIRRETKNHVPAILATILISKQPEKYGFDYEPEPLQRYESVEVEGPVDLRVLAKCAGTDTATLKQLNPALRRMQTPPNGKTDVRVPLGAGEQTLAELKKVPRSERVLYARHRVEGGDTLYEISRAYGVSVRAIQDSNSMGRRTLIRPGQLLVIPTAASSDYASYAAAAETANAVAGDPFTYRVRRGDNLWSISRRYRTTPAAIAAASGIHVNSTLSIGKRLTVVPGVRSTNQARRIATGERSTRTASNRPATHTVRRGDSLWRIASRYNTTVDQLCELNSISRNTTLYPGKRLRIAAAD